MILRKLSSRHIRTDAHRNSQRQREGTQEPHRFKSDRVSALRGSGHNGPPLTGSYLQLIPTDKGRTDLFQRHWGGQPHSKTDPMYNSKQTLWIFHGLSILFLLLLFWHLLLYGVYLPVCFELCLGVLFGFEGKV